MKNFKLLFAPLLVLPFATNCANTGEYKVSAPDTNGVIVSPGTVAKGKDYVGTISIAQDLVTDKVLPNALDKVTSGNKVLQQSEYTYTLKADKLSADFKIPSANLTGDVAIQLSLVDKEDPHKVTKEEFQRAFNFNNVHYLKIIGNDPSVTEVNLFSPTVTYSKFINHIHKQEYLECYCKKDGDVYTQAVCNSNKVFKELDASAEDFFTPTQAFENYCLHDIPVPEFESFTFDNDTKMYSCSWTYRFEYEGEMLEIPVYHKIQFLDKKIVQFYLSEEIEEQTEVMANVTLNYEETTPTYPHIPDYTTNEDEFRAGFAFTGSNYVQLEATFFIAGIELTISIEYAPSILHQITHRENAYTEMYIKHENDVATEGVIRREDSGQFEEMTAEELANVLIKPADYVKIMFDVDEIDYDSDISYSDTYKYHTCERGSVSATIQFADKKLYSLELSDGYITSTEGCSYNQIVPEWPIKG